MNKSTKNKNKDLYKIFRLKEECDIILFSLDSVFTDMKNNN